jgi:hypothetical protein
MGKGEQSTTAGRICLERAFYSTGEDISKIAFNIVFNLHEACLQRKQHHLPQHCGD